MGAMEDDSAAASEETNFARARKSVLESLQLIHPITYDQYYVCSMVKAGSVKKQKLGFLQFLCSEPGLGVPDPPVRKKATYLALLEEVV